MKIIYPYNEILPLRRAHDAYIIRNCAALADQGHDVTLLIGSGSWQTEKLFDFYNLNPSCKLKVVRLPILRRKNLLKLQWNYLFFWFTQKYIEKLKPDCVILSVLKQAHFHIKKKLKDCHYIYEVHQLRWYPSLDGSEDQAEFEKDVFNHFDLITVTTKALKEILKAPPYHIKTPIEKVPLACDFAPLPQTKKKGDVLHLYYVGQLYASQGIEFLLHSIKEVKGIHLHIVGGKREEIEKYQKLTHSLQIEDRVIFEGFYSSKELPLILNQADAFITTFDQSERMPYVAHTKLYEYQAWQRPIIAPKLSVVEEHLPQGACLYEPESQKSLTKALQSLLSEEHYKVLLDQSKRQKPNTWEKRGCLFNKILNKISSSYESTHIRNQE